MLSARPIRNSRSAGPRIERLVPGDERLDPGEDDPHRVHEDEGAGSGAHALRSPRHEFVAEQCAQAGEVVAHGRLREAEPGCGSRHAALREQGVEGDEEVQVETTKISVVDAHHESDLLD